MRHIGSIGLIVLFCFLTTFATAAVEPAKTHFDYRREAVAAYQAKDSPAMLAACESALQLRPDSPRYFYNLAIAQLLTSQPDAALGTLRQLAALGISMSIARSEDLAPLRERPEFAAILNTMAGNLAPHGKLTTLHELPETAGILEGLAWRESTGDLFVGDVHQRCIWRIGADGRLVPFSQSEALYGVFGLVVDEARDALWAATSSLPEIAGYSDAIRGRAALAEISLKTGELRRLIPIPDDGREHVLGDLTLAPDGTVYLTDSVAPIIWRLLPDATELEIFCESTTFASLQGIGLIHRGKSLLISDYANGLHVIDLATRKIHSLTPPAHITLLGMDGLLVSNEAIYAVQNGISPQRVVRFTLTPSSDTITDFAVVASGLPGMEDLTLISLVSGRPTFIAGSGWTQFDGAKEPPPPHPSRILQLPTP